MSTPDSRGRRKPLITRRLLRFVWILMVIGVVSGEMLPSTSAPIRLMDELNANDKLLHFMVYLTLMLLPALHETRPLTWALALGIALLEFGQGFAGGRSFDIRDMAANAVGVLSGLAMAGFLRPRVAAAAGWDAPETLEAQCMEGNRQ